MRLPRFGIVVVRPGFTAAARFGLAVVSPRELLQQLQEGQS
jgi:hypothetical protein